MYVLFTKINLSQYLYNQRFIDFFKKQMYFSIDFFLKKLNIYFDYFIESNLLTKSTIEYYKNTIKKTIKIL
jgi:hypothetical protein